MDELKELKVLIVDDDPEWLAALKEILEHAGANVTTAVDGEEGFSSKEYYNPHVVITDTNMPRLDGVELLKRIRSRGDLTPVIVLFTTSTKGYTQDSIIQDGASAVLKKITEPEKLFELLMSVREGLRK